MPAHTFIIETPRLLLRQKAVEDAPFFFELNADPLVTQYTGDGPFKDLQDAEKIVRYVIGQYTANGYGRWMVLEKETRTPLGWCGLKYHEDTWETDIGYRFMQKHWGKGYATESAKACIEYGFKHFNLHHIIGNAMKDNVASIKVFEKLGMNYLRESLIDHIPSVTYEMYKENYN